MNGAHDLGGMHGFGALDIETDEPVFHEEWEARCFAMNILMGGWRKWNIDMSRHTLERLPPAKYLGSDYYQRWTEKLTILLQEHELVRADELATGQPAPDHPRQTPPITTGDVAGMLFRGASKERNINRTPAYAIGDAVRTTIKNAQTHTRLPRYASGRTGEIVLVHGAHVLPDSHAHGGGEAPEYLYAVRFAAQTLFGPDANPHDSITLDLWESYLDTV